MLSNYKVKHGSYGTFLRHDFMNYDIPEFITADN